MPLLHRRKLTQRHKDTKDVKRLCAFVFFVSLCLFPSLLSGCLMGPKYKRPTVQVPDVYRNPDTTKSTIDSSIGDVKWQDVFKDEQLQKLITIAVERNYDLRDAIARVDAARASLGVTRSNQLPNITGTVSGTDVRTSASGQIPFAIERKFGTWAFNLLSFEVDVWGRVRRQVETARANLAAAEWQRKFVITTIISDVATAYLTLRELDHELDIAKRTLSARQESLRLIDLRYKGGIATLLDLRQAQQLVYAAEQLIPTIEQRIEQTENSINLLLANNPGGITRGVTFTKIAMPTVLPPGLPSRLLERRPDIQEAEQNLIAANAQIGAAKAAFFPQIMLTGSWGGQSSQLTNLFYGSGRTWNFTPQATQPIFMAGRLKSNLKLTKAQQQSSLALYEKAVQSAFSDVSNTLIANTKLKDSRTEQEALVFALTDRTRLAYMRYRGGVDTLLNALDADTSQFNAELELARIRLNELLSVVQMYKALGGGWSQ